MLAGLKETISGKKTQQLAAEMAESMKRHESHSTVLSDLRSDITAVSANVKLLTEQQNLLQKENSSAIDSVKELKDELSDSINSIKVMSSTIQNTLTRKITDDISNLTQAVADKLSGAEALKKQIEETATAVKAELKSLTDEIAKIQKVMSTIKAEDFELTKFSNQLKAADDEKLRLMRQIDSMQRLVSALRRRR